MFGGRISALALLLSCASAPVQANIHPAFDGDCWQGVELEALKVQRFKTMLLVAMLNCRDMEPSIGPDYNSFVRANRDLIARKQAVVRQHFIRTRGPAAGLTAYSNYETALGNRFSSANFTEDRCADMASEARHAGYMSETGLLDLVQSVPDEDDVTLCRAQPQFVARPQWAPPAPFRDEEPAVVETAANEWPDLAPVDPEGPARAIDPNEVRVAEVTPPPPAAMPERLPEPVQVAAVEVPQPLPAVDRMQAVRDAAKALREALSALEADEAKTTN